MNTTEYEVTKRKVRRYEELDEQLGDIERVLTQLESGGAFGSLAVIYGGCCELLFPNPAEKGQLPNLLPKKQQELRLHSSLTGKVRDAVIAAIREQAALTKKEISSL